MDDLNPCTERFVEAIGSNIKLEDDQSVVTSQKGNDDVIGSNMKQEDTSYTVIPIQTSFVLQIKRNRGYFHPDTKVRMADGKSKPISEINVGDELCGDNNEFRKVTSKINGELTAFHQLILMDQSKADGYVIGPNNILVLRAITVTPSVRKTTGSAYALLQYVKCRYDDCGKDNCSKKGFRPKSISYRTKEEAERALEELNRIIANRSDEKYVFDGEIFEMTAFDFVKICCNSTKQCRLKGYKVSAKIREINAELPIDPYFVGLWLGDGSTGKIEITSVDIETENYLFWYATQFDGISVTKDTKPAGTVYNHGIVSTIDCHKYRFVRKDRRRNQIRKILEELGILTDKHIPDIYLYSTVENRLLLLAGLIDSDGSLAYDSVREGKCRFEFYQGEIRKKLFDQVCEMCKAMGFTSNSVYTRSRSPSYGGLYKDGRTHHESYSLQIGGKMMLEVPCKVARKNARVVCAQHKFFVPNTSVPKISWYGGDRPSMYTSITVDGNHRFLLEDLTVVRDN